MGVFVRMGEEEGLGARWVGVGEGRGGEGGVETIRSLI